MPAGRIITHLRRYAVRHYSRISPPPPAHANPIIRVSNNVAELGLPKKDPKPRQLMSLPRFPGFLTGEKSPGSGNGSSRITAIRWVKHYFADVPVPVIQSHFKKGLVYMEFSGTGDFTAENQRPPEKREKISLHHVMEVGDRVHVAVSVAESRLYKRFDTIPSGTLYPNADEIAYLKRLVVYKDSALIVLNKPPKLPVKGNMPVHNSFDALAAGALSYDYDEAPKLVHRLDRESSGLVLMGRTGKSRAYLQWLFSGMKRGKCSSESWNDACSATCQRYWALVIGRPKEKEGVIRAPLSKVVMNGGKSERVMLAHPWSMDASQEAVTEYRVLGPTINGCSWIELKPLTGRRHQLRVHCAEALETPILGDYEYGWYVQRKWKQMPRMDVEPTTGLPYKMRRPAGISVQKGSVLSKVPLLHLHSRETVLPNIEKFLESEDRVRRPGSDLLRFVVPMPEHMKISWNLMSSYLV